MVKTFYRMPVGLFENRSNNSRMERDRLEGGPLSPGAGSFPGMEANLYSQIEPSTERLMISFMNDWTFSGNPSILISRKPRMMSERACSSVRPRVMR
jgi:hypothetical protein